MRIPQALEDALEVPGQLTFLAPWKMISGVCTDRGNGLHEGLHLTDDALTFIRNLLEIVDVPAENTHGTEIPGCRETCSGEGMIPELPCAVDAAPCPCLLELGPKLADPVFHGSDVHLGSCRLQGRNQPGKPALRRINRRGITARPGLGAYP